MASLLKRVEARMMDPKLNANFNRAVSRKTEITEEQKLRYAQAHEAFEEYKKKDPNWMQHFE